MSELRFALRYFSKVGWGIKREERTKISPFISLMLMVRQELFFKTSLS